VAGAWLVFWIGAVRIWRFVRRANDFGSKQSTRSAIVLGACAGLIALLAHSFVDFDIHIPGVAIVAVTLLAVVSGHWRFATERFWVKPGIVGRLIATLACVAAMSWMGYQLLRLWPEQHYLNQVGEKETLTPEDFEFEKKAYAVEPKNPQTPYKIGEFLRKESWTGLGDYEKKAQEAIGWYEKAIALNPYDPHGFLGKGLCLDWLGKTDEGWGYFRQAMLLDPDSYFTRAYYGWHFFQLRDYDRAWKWFELSMRARPGNPIASPYMQVIYRRKEEANAAKAIGQPVIVEPAREK
jgi:hypothetical protein